MAEVEMAAPTFITLQQAGVSPGGEVSLLFGAADGKSYRVNLHRDIIAMVLLMVQTQATKLPKGGPPLPLTQFLRAEGFETGKAPDGEPLLVLQLEGGIQFKLALDPTGLATLGERISALALTT